MKKEPNKRDSPRQDEVPPRVATPSLGIRVLKDIEDLEMWDNGTIVEPLEVNNDSRGDEEQPVVANDEEEQQETPAPPPPTTSSSTATLLPVASEVETPPELLERLRKLEEERNAVPHATLVDQTAVAEKKRRHNRRLGILVATGIIIILVIILGTTLGTRNNNDVPKNIEPTPSPTLSPESVAVQELIESVSFDGGAALRNASSPQSMALEWLQQDSMNTAYEDWRLIQRYVLAVLYYSTNGENWVDNTNWLSDENECTWYTSSTNNGQICNEANSQYLQVVLSRNGLAGTVPEELALLSDFLRKSFHAMQ